MFAHKKSSSNPEGVARVEELEAELAAARQLIADQRQILEANLGALAEDRNDPEDLTPELPPLRAHPLTAVSDRPPIPLPEFGPQTTEIADRVFRAAGMRGIGDSDTERAPARSPRPAPTAPAPSVSDYTTSHARSSKMPFVLTACLLIGALGVAGLWTHMPSGRSSTGRNEPASVRTGGALPVLASRPAIDTAQSRIPEPPKASSDGPILDPAPASPAIPVVRATAVPTARHEHAVVVAHSRTSAPTVIKASWTPVRVPPSPIRTERQAAVSHSVRTSIPTVAGYTHAHRRAVHLVAGTARVWKRESRRGTDEEAPAGAFEREARRHPQPGWDENDDRWLDKF